MSFDVLVIRQPIILFLISSLIFPSDVLNEVVAVMLQYYFCDMIWPATFFIIVFFDLLFSYSLQANSIEPSIGRKPNVIHAIDCKTSI